MLNARVQDSVQPVAFIEYSYYVSWSRLDRGIELSQLIESLSNLQSEGSDAQDAGNDFCHRQRGPNTY